MEGGGRAAREAVASRDWRRMRAPVRCCAQRGGPPRFPFFSHTRTVVSTCASSFSLAFDDAAAWAVAAKAATTARQAVRRTGGMVWRWVKCVYEKWTDF